ncbi:MAG: glycosyltransferase family 4 protein [Bacillota bacterium]
MRIGLDINPLVTGHRFRGIGTYVKNLLQGLLYSGSEHSFLLFTSTGEISLPEQTTHRTIGPGGFFRAVWENNIDILHITDFYHPAYNLSDLLEIKRHGVKLVISVADAIPLRFPEHYPNEKLFMEKNLTPLIPLVDRVITISRESAEDLIKFFSLPPESVSVTHLGVDFTHFSPTPTPSDNENLQKYGISHPYFLYVGGLDWRKNCETILRAFNSFMKENSMHYQMVLVGNDPLTPYLKSLVQDWPQKMVQTGFVPASDLPSLYRRATAFLFPSRCEGFGLPILEAMACGTPVLSSNRGSLPEILGDGGILIDPDQIEAWKIHMSSLSMNPTLAEDLRIKGLNRCLYFSWEKCARATLEVYLSCL